MTDINSALEAIEEESRRIIEIGDSIDYTFLPSISRRLRKLETRFPRILFSAICNRIESEMPSIAWRAYLGSLRKLLPNQYMQAISASSEVGSGFDDRLLPSRLSEIVNKAIYSGIDDVAESAISLSHRIGSVDFSESILSIARSDDSPIRNSALFYLSCRAADSPKTIELADKLLTFADTSNLRANAFQSVVAGNHLDLMRSALRRHTRISDVSELLNVVLDYSREDHVVEISNVLSGIDFAELPNATLRRIRRNSLLSRGEQDSAKLRIEEDLGIRVERNRDDPKFGCLIHRNSGVSSLWVGHAGIYIGDNDVVHCTTGHDPNAVHRLSIEAWISGGGDFWGYRRDENLADDRRLVLVDRALELCSWKTKYDGAHNNQKGEWFEKCVKRNWYGACVKEERDYWESDCVGLVEHCFEHAGGNPTPNDFESGLGWPLTPREQRDHTEFVSG